MEFDPNLKARLVWDGGDEVSIPEELGTPREDQMQGTAGERLSELSGRICYDSLGKGRSSRDYVKHIVEVGHLSVLEHYNLTVNLYPVKHWEILKLLLNRPGLWVEPDGDHLRLTLNLRTILEWDRWSRKQGLGPAAYTLGAGIRVLAEDHAPNLLGKSPNPALDLDVAFQSFGFEVWEVVEPFLGEEKWVSLYLSGSRGYSHEMVRHGDRTAISQRSTRYVDEGGRPEDGVPPSPWIEHPLTSAFLASEGPFVVKDPVTGEAVEYNLENPIYEGQRAYRIVAKQLEAWLKARGVDKTTARKQARGAARGYLGNALQTEMIFSASVAQWKHILNMRLSNAADAEIRAVMARALPELKRSRWGEEFEGYEMEAAGDVIGLALTGGGHK